MIKSSLLFVFLVGIAEAAEPVTDEAQRMKALTAAFPGTQIAVVPGRLNLTRTR